jgi:hypothetical protein
MNVKQLKEQLWGVPDEAVIVIPGLDHSYRFATFETTTAMVYPGRHVCEDYGDKHNAPGGKRIPVLLIM